ncbi:hydroxymethylpyrimidine/phosphomethylpyrimidine kinase [Deinobacterium chartae]|uniref:hydroxymethylpyrimidine kinase n=1 Tax=Deinobacterium chartae TaxID=521158 RepID=A0A841I5D5_9DEIO|nr:bifunctional hydroxymethylpyrimidine kinase/phosphomethylpyrimidine kinase [Deinobacterium chartae]MBB6099650.1 hydroxymethylpyrimidine/phosphomethylpyrimidine kinase [Deinobacterium chartae]
MKRVALTVAGSDPSGGAGVQADLKTFAAHGVYGLSALTLLTVQNTLGVRRVQVIEPELVHEQIQALLEDFEVAAVKIGALGSAGVVQAVARALEACSAPLVIDPVLLSTSGRALLDAAGLEALRALLLPRAALITPNLPEAEVLCELPGGALRSEGLEAFVADPPPLPLLLKGGHGAGETLSDILLWRGRQRRFTHPRRFTQHTHGTGCTLSSAVAARLALGCDLEEAVAGAVAYLQRALESAPGLGRGRGPLEHCVDPGKQV